MHFLLGTEVVYQWGPFDYDGWPSSVIAEGFAGCIGSSGSSGSWVLKGSLESKSYWGLNGLLASYKSSGSYEVLKSLRVTKSFWL